MVRCLTGIIDNALRCLRYRTQNLSPKTFFTPPVFHVAFPHRVSFAISDLNNRASTARQKICTVVVDRGTSCRVIVFSFFLSLVLGNRETTGRIGSSVDLGLAYFRLAVLATILRVVTKQCYEYCNQ